MYDRDFRRRLAEVGKVAVNWNASDWTTVGLLTASSHLVNDHPRLLRALSWGDDDVPANAVEVVGQIVTEDPGNLKVLEDFIRDDGIEVMGLGQAENISTTPSKGRLIVFRPEVFSVPDEGVDPSLVAVMMPFASGFQPVFDAIASAARRSGGRAVRVMDIWDHSTIIQDVFSLIFRAQVVVCDFSGKNPNVFYEAGIAHTLGKLVIPITQSGNDIPFDIAHHRYLLYLANGEGLQKLEHELSAKLSKVVKLPF
jgi:hypothetical protein